MQQNQQKDREQCIHVFFAISFHGRSYLMKMHFHKGNSDNAEWLQKIKWNGLIV